jgi:hypothetical protein
MLMHVVLFAGHKTITHTISFIDKYRCVLLTHMYTRLKLVCRSLLQDFAYASPENERRMLEAVTEAWVHSPWHVGFIVDALMRRAVLTPSTGTAKQSYQRSMHSHRCNAQLPTGHFRTHIFLHSTFTRGTLTGYALLLNERLTTFVLRSAASCYSSTTE